jgi:hypothetical protein
LEGCWSMRRLSLCCSIGLDVVFDPYSHTLPAIRADEPQLICVFLLDLIPGEERALPIDSRWEKLNHSCAWRGRFIFISNWVPAMPGTQVRDSESPRRISPYCPQNSAYTYWFCPGGSVCSIPLFPRSALSSNVRVLILQNLKMWTFWSRFFLRVAYFSEPRWTTHYQISQET